MEITLQTSNCMGLCNSHVLRVTGARVHDFNEYAIESWLGWSFVLLSFDSMFDTATVSVPPLYTLSAEAVDGVGS